MDAWHIGTDGRVCFVSETYKPELRVLRISDRKEMCNIDANCGSHVGLFTEDINGKYVFLVTEDFEPRFIKAVAIHEIGHLLIGYDHQDDLSIPSVMHHYVDAYQLSGVVYPNDIERMCERRKCTCEPN